MPKRYYGNSGYSGPPTRFYRAPNQGLVIGNGIANGVNQAMQNYQKALAMGAQQRYMQMHGQALLQQAQAMAAWRNALAGSNSLEGKTQLQELKNQGGVQRETTRGQFGNQRETLRGQFGNQRATIQGEYGNQRANIYGQYRSKDEAMRDLTSQINQNVKAMNPQGPNALMVTPDQKAALQGRQSQLLNDYYQAANSHPSMWGNGMPAQGGQPAPQGQPTQQQAPAQGAPQAPEQSPQGMAQPKGPVVHPPKDWQKAQPGEFVEDPSGGFKQAAGNGKFFPYHFDKLPGSPEGRSPQSDTPAQAAPPPPQYGPPTPQPGTPAGDAVRQTAYTDALKGIPGQVWNFLTTQDPGMNSPDPVAPQGQ